MGEALLGALAAALGDGWTDEVEEAWRLAYNLTAEAMMTGASSPGVIGAVSPSACASSPRPEMPSFVYTFCRWLLTVRIDRNEAGRDLLGRFAVRRERRDLTLACTERHERRRGRNCGRACPFARLQETRRLRARRSSGAAIALALVRVRSLGRGFGGEERGADLLEAFRGGDHRFGTHAGRGARVGRVRGDQRAFALAPPAPRSGRRPPRHHRAARHRAAATLR